jgi:dihydropteroate synthase
MGIVNATPDSFYSGSRAPSLDDAVALALRMVEEGADIVDVGGMSTRPGSDPVPESVELSRTIGVIEQLRARTGAPISIDTSRASVAREALRAGASILNDVTALRGDAAMAEAAKAFSAVILMHLGGADPRTMQDHPRYEDVVREVGAFLRERKDFFIRSGGDGNRVLVDPGIGFGKTLDHNLSLLKHVAELADIGPVVLGASRKSFLGRIMARGTEAESVPGPEDRLPGSLGVACWAAMKGVRVLRVHDVLETRCALEALSRVAEAP